MGPLTGVETLFIVLGVIAICAGVLLGLGALMGGMNEEDEHGEGLD